MFGFPRDFQIFPGFSDFSPYFRIFRFSGFCFRFRFRFLESGQNVGWPGMTPFPSTTGHRRQAGCLGIRAVVEARAREERKTRRVGRCAGARPHSGGLHRLRGDLGACALGGLFLQGIS
jgi:hypothetical protein